MRFFRSLVMKKITVAAMMIALASGAYANSGIWGSFVQITANGGAAQWYDAQYASALPDFQGANLGTFNPGAGNTLVISGGEVDIFKDGTDNVTGANLNWRVWSGSPSGTFTVDGLGFTANEPFNNAAGDAAAVGGSLDQKWAQISTTPNVLQGLTPGTYTLEVYMDAPFTFTGGSGTHFSNNGGSNYRATFVVVPEPSSLAFAGIGLLGIIASRRIARA
jgi:hypothetical protein